MATVNFLAPAPGATFSTRSGNYTADSNSLISNVAITGSSIIDLLAEGCIPLAFNASANFRDLLDGGDFTVAPWQRNVAGLASAGAIASAITNTATYFADRWFHVAGASGSVTPAKVTDTAVAGYNVALKVQRTAANTDTTAIQTGQILEGGDSIRCQGQYLTFSILAKAGANFSAAGNTLTASIVGGTGSNQSAANLIAGSWTGQATLATQAFTLTNGYNRFVVTTTAPVPATITELAVLLSFTPVGTAGTDDSFSLLDTQLELGSVATPWERRDVQVELEICQRYAWVIAEPASSVVVASGSVSASNTEIFYLALPVQMWKAPAVTAVVGAFKVNSSTAGVVAATGLTGNATHTSTTVGLTSTGTGTAGQAALLQGGGGSGYVVVSADL